VAKNAFFSRFRKALQIKEREIVERNGKVFGVYEFIKPTLWVAEPEILRNILSKDFHIFPNRRVSETYIIHIFKWIKKPDFYFSHF